MFGRCFSFSLGGIFRFHVGFPEGIVLNFKQPLGEMIQFEVRHIFEMGWFNHQPEIVSVI